MVRLFAARGEGQHAVVTRDLEPLPAEPDAHHTVKYACLAAGAWTGVLSILGKSRPGTFLRCTAVIAPFFIADKVVWLHGAYKWVDYAYKKDGLEPKPAKLVDWSGQITMDTCALAGSIIGLALASRAKPFPGATGWQRYVGASCVGWAAGSVTGQLYFVRTPQYRLAVAEKQASNMRSNQAFASGNIAEAMRDPAIVGQLASWRIAMMRKLDAIWYAPLHSATPATSTVPQQPPPARPNPTYLRLVAFEDSCLAGCDHDGTSRTYKSGSDAITSEDLGQRVDDLTRLKQSYEAELKYVWDALAKKEVEFYKMSEENDIKDDIRRQLQLLSTIVEDMYLKVEAIEFNIKDTRKLQDIWEDRLTLQPDTHQLYTPHLTTEAIRNHWQSYREIIYTLDEALKNSNPQIEAALAQLGLGTEESREALRKNLRATERLLKEFEDQVQRADSPRDV